MYVVSLFVACCLLVVATRLLFMVWLFIVVCLLLVVVVRGLVCWRLGFGGRCLVVGV